MSRKFLIITCMVMMTVALSGCTMPWSDKGEETTKDGSSTKQDKKSNGGDGNYFETMSDLMERGKTMKCTYYQELPQGDTADGVVYMADKNARVEIIANKGTDHEGKMYSLTNQEWNYTWTEGSSSGYKMTLEALEMSEKNKETISKMTDEIEFECKSWKKDNSKFKAPSNIVFEDMSEMMEGFGDIDLEQEIKNAEAQANEFLCNLCKNAPDPEECLGGVVCDWQ
ncbi:hypothetical protein K8R42_03240 [bacterium]|nr:hypothetical protein [bacterium]